MPGRRGTPRALCRPTRWPLRVTDAAHPASTKTVVDYIVTDTISASFTSSLLVAPNIFQFTDTSTPTPTAWAWDFDNDGIVDSTVQNPVYPIPQCSAAIVTLRATRLCKSDTATQSLFFAPNSLTTLFAANNGGSAGWIVMFDVNVLNAQGVNICAMDHNTGTTTLGTPFSVDVYVTDGGWAGKDNDIAPWRLAATGSGTAQGNDQPSNTPLNTPLYLPSGSYGLAVHYNGASVRYTGTGTSTTPVVYGNADLSLSLGAVRSTLFNGGSFFQVRQWNGTVHYDTAATGSTPGYGFFGPGCPSTLGITNLTATSTPALGTTLNVDMNNLPLSVAVMMIGLSKTSSVFGPLPLDLALLGAPGCSGRVSPDVSSFLLGAGNQATWSLTLPNLPVLLGTVFFNQAIVPAPGINAFGAVTSDAAGAIIGN